jgi:hypothetical protein
MTEPTEPDAPDPGIDLSIQLPLILAPKYRAADAVILHGYNAETGELLFTRHLIAPEHSKSVADPDVAIETRIVEHLLLVAYDGDDGAIFKAELIHTNCPGGESDERGVPSRLAKRLAEAKGDPDKPCSICDDTVPGGADIDHTECHGECVLMNLIGPLGYHLDRAFWIDNMNDPYAGRTIRQAAIELDRLVTLHGFRAVATGSFPKDGM